LLCTHQPLWRFTVYAERKVRGRDEEKEKPRLKQKEQKKSGGCSDIRMCSITENQNKKNKEGGDNMYIQQSGEQKTKTKERKSFNIHTKPKHV